MERAKESGVHSSGTGEIGVHSSGTVESKESEVHSGGAGSQSGVHSSGTGEVGVHSSGTTESERPVIRGSGAGGHHRANWVIDDEEVDGGEDDGDATDSSIDLTALMTADVGDRGEGRDDSDHVVMEKMICA